MTPRTRPLARTRRAALLFTGALGLLALVGCDPRQALYFLQPFEPTIAPPKEIPPLKGKRVVLIAKAAPGALNDYPTLDRELTKEIASRLRGKIKKLDLVEQEKVWTWDHDHPTWTDPAELAEKFEADLVCFFEVSEFQIQSPSSPELFEGKAKVHVRVIQLAYPKDDRGHEMKDKPKESEVVFDDDHDTNFPTRAPIPASAEFGPGMFRKKFLRLVADELSWYFVDHAPGDNIQDVKFSRDY